MLAKKPRKLIAVSRFLALLAVTVFGCFGAQGRLAAQAGASRQTVLPYVAADWHSYQKT
jgi:hypothetical protein